jgi:hypothetical protein
VVIYAAQRHLPSLWRAVPTREGPRAADGWMVARSPRDDTRSGPVLSFSEGDRKAQQPAGRTRG